MSFYVEAPPLIVGFDTETTGLDTNEDEIISYGFVVTNTGNVTVSGVTPNCSAQICASAATNNTSPRPVRS